MKSIFLFIFLGIAQFLFAQDVSLLLKEADNYDKQLKEQEAIDKYREILSADSNNYRSILRLTEIFAARGARHKVEKQRIPFYDTAFSYAVTAMRKDSVTADSYYLMGLVNQKKAEVVRDRESADYLREMKQYADKAVSINPNHSKALLLAGKWHLDVTKATFFTKAAAKTIYGGLPKASIDVAIDNLEKARKIDPYFVQAYFELARAYEANNQPTQQIDVLNKLVKLPLRTPDDAAWKAEAKKMLEQMK